MTSLHSTGTDTTYNVEKLREDQLLQKYIFDNWSCPGINVNDVAFGNTLQQLGRGTIGGKVITLYCYNVAGASRMNLKGLASNYVIDALVRVDIGVRDIKASSNTGIEKNRSAKVTALSNYLREFISVNSTGMQPYGVNGIRIHQYPEISYEALENVILFHVVVPVMLSYMMNKY